MSTMLEHRGPDAQGYLLEIFDHGKSSIALGHRRLAIIDLDAEANQPMSSSDGRHVVIFNGEIYNYIELRAELEEFGHRFSTRSDTEVLLVGLKQWGEGVFSRLNGMYAFAVWDRLDQSLLLARDPFGKKPLFIAERDGLLVFASEIETMLAMPGLEVRFDTSALGDYLVLRYVPGPRTFFSGIRKLPPGTFARWKAGSLTIRRHFTPPDIDDAQLAVHGRHAPQRFLELFDEAVSLRMRSDASFGAFLSGGVDSASVVAMMRRHSTGPLRTYAVGFPEQLQAELPAARRIAEYFDTEHEELVIGPDQILGPLPDLVRRRGAPLSETADVPIYLMSRLAARDTKMVLTGEGADEVLGGYPKHRAEMQSALYRAMVPRTLHDDVVTPLLHHLPDRRGRLRTFARAMGERDDRSRMPAWFASLSPGESALLSGVEEGGLAIEASRSRSALRRILYFDQISWLPDNLLERGDRMMMAASLEGRMPFLDRNLVTFASSLPDRLRAGPGGGKTILRRAMRDILPDGMARRTKLGFRAPVDAWFRTQWRDVLRDHLCSPASAIRGYLDGEQIDRIVAEHDSGDINHEKALWALLNLEVFHRAFAIS